MYFILVLYYLYVLEISQFMVCLFTLHDDFSKIVLFTLLFIFGCTGSSLLFRLFSSCGELLLLLLLSCFSRVRLCATSKTAAHQASPVPGILQARTLEWVAISFSNA